MTTPIDVTVTYLEMTAPPTAPAKPLSQPSGAPTTALMRVAEPAPHFFLYLYSTVGAAHDWTDMLRLAPDALKSFVCDPKVELYTLYRGGAPAGFFQLDFRVAGGCDLAYFGLFPETVGQGLGPWLLSSAQHEAWRRTREPAIERMTVNTCTLDHPAALKTYQRAGFQPVRRETVQRTPARPPLANSTN